MRHYAAVLLMLAALADATPALAIAEFAAGAWKGAALFPSARFSHCAMLTRQGQWTLTVSLDRAGQMNLGLKHGQLKFTRDEAVTGWTRIGDAAATPRRFKPTAHQLLVVKLGADDARRLQQGARMTWQVGDIAGGGIMPPSAEAFAKLAACVAKRGRV